MLIGIKFTVTMYRRDSNLERQEELLWEKLSLHKQYMKNAKTSLDFTLIVIPKGTRQAFTETLSFVSSEDLEEDYFLPSCVPGLCPVVNVLRYSGTPDRTPEHYKSSMWYVTLIDWYQKFSPNYLAMLSHFPSFKKRTLLFRFSFFFSG